MQDYRIKQVWDMLDYSGEGEPVIGQTTNEKGQKKDTIYVGRQYIGEEAILNKRHSADGLTQLMVRILWELQQALVVKETAQ